MIILRLRGGLGNQLFQYAAGKSLAQFHHTSLKLDLYFYRTHSNRKFELENFNIPIELASREEVHRFTGSNPVTRFLNKRENYLRCPEVFTQPYYHFYDDFFGLPGNLYVSGYFQSEKYFKQSGAEIRNWYTAARPLDHVNEKLAEEMRSTASVAIHVRRGDYTNQYASFFGTVPDEYYQRAIQEIQTRVANAKFIVFSDDIAWCKKNLSLHQPVFVEHNKGADSYKDLVLMSHCKHNIIANSTFSWWGAWLNKNPDKVVIAPKVWFREAYFKGNFTVYPARIYNTKDLIPEEWIRL
jgi:hypothetical protein